MSEQHSHDNNDEHQSHDHDGIGGEYLTTFTSVGIDIGSSTSHLTFSRHHIGSPSLQRRHPEVLERKVISRSSVLLTPLRARLLHSDGASHGPHTDRLWAGRIYPGTHRHGCCDRYRRGGTQEQRTPVYRKTRWGRHVHEQGEEDCEKGQRGEKRWTLSTV